MGALIYNFNTCKLATTFEKYSKLYIQIERVTFKIQLFKIMSKRNLQKIKILDFMGKTNLFLAPYLSTLGLLLAIWLHLRIPHVGATLATSLQ